MVPELHKSGAIHYHGVYFNLPFIWVETFKNKIWKYGAIDLQVSRKIRDTASYLSKYLTKDYTKKTPKNTKMYFMSRGLIQPTEEFTSLPPRDTIKVLTITHKANGIKIKYLCKNNESPAS